MPKVLPKPHIGIMSDVESDSVGERPDGPAIIRDFVKRLPAKPGVYRMFDQKGDVIYVGKARHLKNRVAN